MIRVIKILHMFSILGLLVTFILGLQLLAGQGNRKTHTAIAITAVLLSVVTHFLSGTALREPGAGGDAPDAGAGAAGSAPASPPGPPGTP